MRKYVEPDVLVVLLEQNDVVTVSNPTAEGGLELENYDHNGNWL